jgi:undecaprenyl diphosphate synthase
MDGNGRWAKARGLPRLFGHRAGAENIHRIVEACADIGVKVLTVYAFSTENWGRPREEVEGLMRLLQETLDREVPQMHEKGVRLWHSGDLSRLSPEMQKAISDALELTRENDRIILNVALNYGGRAEIVEAVRKIIREGVRPEDVTEEMISAHLYTAGLPDPDLIIRTAGEMRLSNFLIWQAAYAEYYSTPVLWPDFDRAELEKALDAYAHRERRFGRLPSSD